jgi:hypothetical protein
VLAAVGSAPSWQPLLDSLDAAPNFNDPPDQWINGRSKILRSTGRDETRSRDRFRIDAHIVLIS